MRKQFSLCSWPPRRGARALSRGRGRGQRKPASQANGRTSQCICIYVLSATAASAQTRNQIRQKRKRRRRRRFLRMSCGDLYQLCAAASRAATTTTPNVPNVHGKLVFPRTFVAGRLSFAEGGFPAHNRTHPRCAERARDTQHARTS